MPPPPHPSPPPVPPRLGAALIAFWGSLQPGGTEGSVLQPRVREEVEAEWGEMRATQHKVEPGGGGAKKSTEPSGGEGKNK